MLDFHPDNPFRPIDWRWSKARWLRNKGKYARKETVEEDVSLIKKYQSIKEKCKKEEDFQYLVNNFPGIYWADHIHDNDQRQIRYIIEARLLANEEPKNIATKSNCSVDTIVWYEKMFFNVLPYLDRIDYILNNAIRPNVDSIIHEREYDVLWKLFGYCGGSHMLDSTICPFGPPSYAVDGDQVDTVRAVMIKKMLHGKTVVATLTIPAAYNQAEIISLYNDMKKLDIDSGTGDTKNLIVNNINATFSGLPFSTEKLMSSEKTLKFYNEQSAELRADELTQLALGQEPFGLKDELSIKLPEQTSNANKKDN